jgi:Protein of unknown function (DUF1493)
MKISPQTTPQLCAYLSELGYGADQIARMHPGTRLVQDLHLDGDDFIEAMELLAQKYKVDMRDFDFAKYASSEGELLVPRWVRRPCTFNA